jgi:mRNA interferase HigB
MRRVLRPSDHSRLSVVTLDFRRQIAFVKFVGTHAEYDRIDAMTVSQF